MKYFLWAIALFITLIFQGYFSLFNIIPNFTIVFAYYAGLKHGDLKGLAIGAFMGAIEDSLSSMFLGPNMLSKGIAGFTASYLYTRFFIWTPLIGMISIVIFTFTDSLMVFMMKSVFDKMPTDALTGLTIILIRSLINAPFGYFLKPREAIS